MPSIAANSGLTGTPLVGAPSARQPTISVPQAPEPAKAPTAAARPELLNAGSAPVDSERVAMIKKAIESDNYPLVPAKIADGIIAAGMLLRAKK